VLIAWLGKNKVFFKGHPPCRKSDVFELIYLDICGLMETKNFSGQLYFITFVDDHLRKLWVYVLKSKDQMLGVFKQFQASI